jgi:hypothetical protein
MSNNHTPVTQPLVSVTENSFLSSSLNLYLLIVGGFSYYAGVCCLVIWSAFQSTVAESENAIQGNIPKDFVLLYLKISVLVASQGAREKELFAFVLHSFITLLQELESSKIELNVLDPRQHTIVPFPAQTAVQSKLTSFTPTNTCSAYPRKRSQFLFFDRAGIYVYVLAANRETIRTFEASISVHSIKRCVFGAKTMSSS